MIFAFFAIFLRFNNNKKIPQKKKQIHKNIPETVPHTINTAEQPNSNSVVSPLWFLFAFFGCALLLSTSTEGHTTHFFSYFFFHAFLNRVQKVVQENYLPRSQSSAPYDRAPRSARFCRRSRSTRCWTWRGLPARASLLPVGALARGTSGFADIWLDWLNICQFKVYFLPQNIHWLISNQNPSDTACI